MDRNLKMEKGMLLYLGRFGSGSTETENVKVSDGFATVRIGRTSMSEMERYGRLSPG
jgi:hypothetical protein